MTWISIFTGKSGYAASSTAEDVTKGIDGTGLTAIVTGNFVLTNSLLDTMKKTASESGKEGMIVMLSSKVHKEEGVNITANSLHPGVINTNFSRHGGFFAMFVNAAKSFLKNIPQGAATTCYVALHPQLNGISGQYFADSNLSKASGYAQDTELAKKLWDFTVKLIESKAWSSAPLPSVIGGDGFSLLKSNEDFLIADDVPEDSVATSGSSISITRLAVAVKSDTS
nr:hypothetical protein [Tanacetum cinerariifolium]